MTQNNVQHAIKQSSEDFLRLVWPAIGARFGRPIPAETVSDNEFAKELDTRAGIDVWLIGTDGHMRGLASRVQWPKRQKAFDTFTVRVRTRSGGPTEIHKRTGEIDKIRAGDVVTSPHYFCQAYVSGDRKRLLSAALARTSDVISAVHMGVGWLLPANGDGTQGWAVPWDELEKAGARIQIWRGGN